MDNKNLQTILIAVFAFVLLNKVTKAMGGIFSSPAGDVRRTQEAQTQQAAGKWGNVSDFPALWRAQPLTEALVSGQYSVAQMEAQRPYTSLIDRAVKGYKEAKGTVWDNEGQAVSAVASMPNYLCLLVMGQTFYNNTGQTLGAYGDTFLEPVHKAAILDVIKHLQR